jgi:hypothetical protein
MAKAFVATAVDSVIAFIIRDLGDAGNAGRVIQAWPSSSFTLTATPANSIQGTSSDAKCVLSYRWLSFRYPRS